MVVFSKETFINHSISAWFTATTRMSFRFELGKVMANWREGKTALECWEVERRGVRSVGDNYSDTQGHTGWEWSHDLLI